METTHWTNPLCTPTGNPVAFKIVEILTIRGKRITEHRVVFDQLGLLRQLGAPV